MQFYELVFCVFTAFFFVYELLDTEIRTILYKFFIYLCIYIMSKTY